MKINFPTLLTLSRIFFLPIGIVCYFLPFPWAHPATAMLAFYVGVTDFFDGYIARRFNQTTRFGAFLDPVADKLAVVTGLILISGEFSNLWITVFSIIIVSRELIISALREWMAALGKRTSVAVAFIGKLKTSIQGVALLFLIWFHSGSAAWVFNTGFYLLIVAVVLTMWSMFVYLKLAWHDLYSE